MENTLDSFKNSTEFGSGAADYIESQYELYLEDPSLVDAAWQQFFDQQTQTGETDARHDEVVAKMRAIARLKGSAGMLPASAAPEGDGYGKQGAVMKLLEAYRARGHLRASLDPLALVKPPKSPDLEPAFHGLNSQDLTDTIHTGRYFGPDEMKLGDLINTLDKTYCGSIGAEFMHITDTEQRHWVAERLETAKGNWLPKGVDPKAILSKLTAAEGLERYLHTKYVGQKRFSLEGGDSLIPMLDQLIEHAAADGINEVIMGMAHRGRLNVLVNTLGKPPEQLFNEFEGKFEDHSDDEGHMGDVKYHMGFSSDVHTQAGSVHLALGFNPSHLEIIDPVIAGSVRARQVRRRDDERDNVLPVLMHGDAAFAGQGVVMELLQMSKARGFDVGGTVHIVINNQIGFTTSHTEDSRSTLYCTDVAKMVGAPILHVNGDDPEAVVFAIVTAFQFRQKYGKDVVVDLICYRRHGHNEADEPAATQPLMYQVIRKKQTTRELYAERLVKRGVLSQADVKALSDAYRKSLEEGDPVVRFEDGKDEFAVDWTPFIGGKLTDPADTNVPADTLKSLSKQLFTPDNVSLHNRVQKIMDDRAKMAAGELPCDWGFCENLAYGSLIQEGYKLRLTGQDAGRGTFFHRHAVWHDQKTGESILKLRELVDYPQDVMVIDSLLSEEAVMAFEYGYATADPLTLVIWEGQFGDFANGAQVVADQFLSSGESKWGRLCGLVLLLPHGYEGQGPEHSSARLERYLQLCALNNMQVCTPTTPAQMFHMLRRQMLRKTRKPLIVMSPKSMLRNKASFVALEELSQGGFQTLIPSREGDPSKAERAIVCGGKVYYDLVAGREKAGLTPEQAPIIRVEQLYPFPREELKAELAKYSQVKRVVWCQEEPSNQGAWYQIQHHLRYCLAKGQKIHYAGRVRSPSPATGHFDVHVKEQNALVNDALTSTKANGIAAE